jgi:hypothetical protein
MADRADLREEYVAFDTFWAAYPRHIAKIAASRAFTKAIKKTTLPVMLAALAWQSQTKQWQQGIIPNASTWLHQERWEDEGPAVLAALAPPAPVVELAKSIARANAEEAERGREEIARWKDRLIARGMSAADAEFHAGRDWLHAQRTRTR